MEQLDIKKLGQVFTPPEIVKMMLSLKKINGDTLEPASGNGSFSNEISDCIAIEKDEKVITSNNVLNMDFFDYPLSNKFDTIIGNPPYVKHNDIDEYTRGKLNYYSSFDNRSNLFLFFIQKSIDHLKNGGELIFITPREFINLTSARSLNQFIFETGTITDFIDLGDMKIFNDACPNVAIWRFQKGNFNRELSGNREFKCINGKLIFSTKNSSKTTLLSNIFEIKVGAVSGADNIFTNDNALTQFVCSTTNKTGKTRKMFYNEKHPLLNQHKNVLLNRRIKKFDESNWWMWGRDFPKSSMPRIYVNCKTRNSNPFFTHNSLNYDGSILALFPKARMDITETASALNENSWGEQGFVCDNRFIFSQRSLSNALIDPEFSSALAKGRT